MPILDSPPGGLGPREGVAEGVVTVVREAVVVVLGPFGVLVGLGSVFVSI